ncbi:MAG TPA: hypothetical protein VFG28_13150 [Syntrophales bacterium]|nr:hypothetical protein [Syntrophales bacterium]
MKHLLTIMIILFAVSAQAADVGVSVSVGQPGFYGRIDIGNAPQPQLIYTRPVVIQPAPAGVVYQPVYVHVPPGHEKKWSKHCSKYNACGKPVYFVRDNWYNDVYVPHYQAQHGKDRGEKHDKGKKNDNHGHGKGHD